VPRLSGSFVVHATASPTIRTLSLHDALPIFAVGQPQVARVHAARLDGDIGLADELLVALERLDRGLLTRFVTVEGEDDLAVEGRSEEHTSELQSRENLVCRLLLEKNKTNMQS